MKKIVFIAILFLQSIWVSPVLAVTNEWEFQSMFENFQESVEEESQNIEDGAEKIVLPDFSDEADEGANIIVLAIQRFLDFFKLIVTPIAVLLSVVMGLRMVAAGNENEEVQTQSKNFIKYALEGMVIIFVADSVVNAFFGAEGEIFINGQQGVEEFATRSSNLFKGIYGLVETVLGSIAVFMLVTAGMRYVGGAYSEDQIGKAKNQIKWSLVGLFVVGIAEFVVKDVLFENQGRTLGIDAAKELFVNLTNFVAGTLGTLSFAFLLYAGYLYVMGAQSEDNVEKAKKIIFTALAGIVIAISAFAIVNTFVELDASR